MHSILIKLPGGKAEGGHNRPGGVHHLPSYRRRQSGD
jgi:hypothetical protein